MSTRAELIARLRDRAIRPSYVVEETHLFNLLHETADALEAADTEQRAAFKALEAVVGV